MKKLFSGLALFLTLLCPFSRIEAQNYALPDKIEEGNILHCFSWPMKYITEELPNIAAAGFGSIQISPLQRPDINEGWTWYTIYLPYDYHVFNSPGMGSREDLRTLCSEADKYGIKIIVDVVINHVNKTEPYYNPWFKDYEGGRYRTWGGDGNINYDSRRSITHDRLGDYVELNTENSNVIARAKAYIEELRDLGVKGIRYDAAKHIELPSETDGNGQGVWPAVTSVTGLFHYGEIVGDCVNGSDEKISEYTQYLWVPDNQYTTKAARENGGIPTANAGGRDSKTGGHLIYWAESHDDYSNDEWSERIDQGVVDRAYCAFACRNTQAALYYSRPRARGKDNIKIEKGSLAFMGKHIVEVNKFRNAMTGLEDYFTHNNGVVSVTRKGGGAVIIAKGANQSVSIANGGGYCPVGTYTDRVSGAQFTVTASTISGNVGPTGVAVIYNDNFYKTTTAPTSVTITGNKLYNVAYAGNFSNGKNYIHYWKDSDKTNSTLNTVWPGIRMERAKGSDGKYYWCAAVPAGVDGIIFNNGASHNDGGMQTGNLPLVSDYIMDNGGATITPVTFKTGSFTTEPTYTTSKTVTIDGDYNIASSTNFEYVHYWGGEKDSSWPGEKMTPSKGDDGNTYNCFKVPAGTKGIIFTNGEAADAKNEKTGDLSYSGKKVMCESGATEVNVIFTYNGEIIEPEPDGNTVVIYGDYNIAYGGDRENIYYWGGTPGPDYPGVKMETAQGSDGKTYKVYKVGENTTKVIFNTGGDSNKTGDLDYSGKYIMYDNGASTTPVEFRPLNIELSDVYVYVDGWSSDPAVFCYIYNADETNNAAWPGKAMSVDDATGYWVYQVPKGLENGSVVIYNGSDQYPENGSVGLALGGSSKILHINGFRWNAYPESGNEDPKPNPGEAAEPTAIPVVWPTDGNYCFLVNASGWSTMALYSYRDNGSIKYNGNWPGTTALTTVGNKKFYNFGTNTPEFIILNNNNKGSQSGDLKFVNGATYYSDSGSDYHIGGADYKSPSTIYLIGNIDREHSWKTNYGLELTKIDDRGIYVGYNLPLQASTPAFSFTTDLGIYDSNWGDLNYRASMRFGCPSDISLPLNTPYHVYQYAGDNIGNTKAWQLSKAGNYDIILDLYHMTVTVLESQSAPDVEALQLVEVQQGAESPISQYDYLTYPPVSGKANGVKVSGDNITVASITVADDIYHDSSNVLFTEKVLVTTTFSGTSAYGLDPQTASIGSKQTDGKFRGILTLDNLDENIIGSKVNYYYTIREGVEVKVPMQSPVGSASVTLAVPEPQIVHSGLTVTKSEKPITFTYEDVDFDACYNIAMKTVEIEEPNITESLDAVAGTLYRVKANGAYMSGTTYQTEIVTPDYFLSDSYEGIDMTIHNYGSDDNTTGRWDAGLDANVATQISMSYNAPTINKCSLKIYDLYYLPVEVDGVTEQHLFEETTLTLDVTSNDNAIKATNGSNEEIASIDLLHSEEGDWYLVEFYKNSKRILSTVVEGFNGPREFTVMYDYGKYYEGQRAKVIDDRWSDEGVEVQVSTLYPFASPHAKASLNGQRRAQGSNNTGGIVETDAARADVETRYGNVSGLSDFFMNMKDECEYFNLQGIRIDRPEVPGIYIVRNPFGETSKVVIR